jgi:predicted nucleotidyltransferase
MKYGLKEDTIKKINEIFAQFPEVEAAILYGSRAKGNFSPLRSYQRSGYDRPHPKGRRRVL